MSIARSIGSNAFKTPDLTNFPEAQRKAVVEAFTHGFRIVFIIWVPLLGICLLTCLLIKDTGLERAEEKDASIVPDPPQSRDVEKKVADTRDVDALQERQACPCAR